jgi:hypothetical protein
MGTFKLFNKSGFEMKDIVVDGVIYKNCIIVDGYGFISFPKMIKKTTCAIDDYWYYELIPIYINDGVIKAGKKKGHYAVLSDMSLTSNDIDWLKIYLLRHIRQDKIDDKIDVYRKKIEQEIDDEYKAKSVNLINELKNLYGGEIVDEFKLKHDYFTIIVNKYLGIIDTFDIHDSIKFSEMIAKKAVSI